MMRLPNNYRAWMGVFSVLCLAVIGGVLGVWWWRSAGYVSTDDARIKAEIVSVSAEMTGRLDMVAKEEGDAVTQGEVLAKLDDREVRIRIQQAQAEVDRSRSKLLQAGREIGLHVERQKGEVPQAEAALRGYRHNLEDARAHAEQAREDWQRAKALFEKELIAAQELDRARTELRQAQAQFSVLQEKVKEGESALKLVRMKEREVAIKEADRQARRADVRHAEATLAELRRKLQLTTIRSPVQGVVVKKNAHRGEVVEPGQPIYMLVDSTRYWVEANVEETEIRFVKPGDKVTIRVDSYPGQDFSGKVIEVGEATVSEFSLFSPQKLTGQFIKSTQRLPVKVAVENHDGLLKVGMLAVVWIEKDSR